MKTANDPLLSVGRIVTATEVNGRDTAQYLIIGKRQYNPESGRCWDYIGVPFPEGFYQQPKYEGKLCGTNVYWFNHTDICEDADSVF